jgi:hypothetical protein
VPNQKNNKIYRISNHLQVVISAICCSYTLYVRSVNFVVCTSASNFLEYIKILPVNKNILLVHLIHLRAAQKCRILDVVNQLSCRRKYQDFQRDFYLKNKRNHKISVLKPEGEVHRQKLRTAVGTVVVAMNLGTSSNGNGVRSTMFLASLFYPGKVLQ